MTIKVNRNSTIDKSCIILLLVCSDNVSIKHRLQDITIFIVYVIVCDLEKSFDTDTTFNIIVTYAFQFLCKYILANVCYISVV